MTLDSKKSGRLGQFTEKGMPARLAMALAGSMVACLLLSVGLLALGESIPIYGLPVSGGRTTLEVVITFLGIFLLLMLLTTLPLLLIITYQQTAATWIWPKIEKDLFLAGISTVDDLDEREKDFNQRNGISAFVWPTSALTLFLLILWGLTIAPNALTGFSSALTLGEPLSRHYLSLDGKKFIEYMINNATLITWGFLGVYFYLLTVLTRRWRLNDLTTGLLWDLNARMVIVIIVGLLLMAAWPDAPILVAFVAGFAPDKVLGWLWSRIKALIPKSSNTLQSDIFEQRDLEQIDGVSFWQAERLVEEGIDSIEDLATKEIPGLLINIRSVDASTLLSWVDKALLIDKVGLNRIELFSGAFIESATDFYDRCHLDSDIGKSLSEISKTIEEARNDTQDQDGRITSKRLQNLLTSLEGPNLKFLIEYWKNADPRIVLEKMTELRTMRLSETDTSRVEKDLRSRYCQDARHV